MGEALTKLLRRTCFVSVDDIVTWANDNEELVCGLEAIWTMLVVESDLFAAQTNITLATWVIKTGVHVMLPSEWTWAWRVVLLGNREHVYTVKHIESRDIMRDTLLARMQFFAGKELNVKNRIM